MLVSISLYPTADLYPVASPLCLIVCCSLPPTPCLAVSGSSSASASTFLLPPLLPFHLLSLHPSFFPSSDTHPTTSPLTELPSCWTKVPAGQPACGDLDSSATSQRETAQGAWAPRSEGGGCARLQTAARNERTISCLVAVWSCAPNPLRGCRLQRAPLRAVGVRLQVLQARAKIPPPVMGRLRIYSRRH